MHKKSSDIIRENLTYMLNNDENTSMRNLSTSIGASDSFIQKILTEKANPSLDKIDSISEYFDIESWEMFYNFKSFLHPHFRLSKPILLFYWISIIKYPENKNSSTICRGVFCER